MRREKGGESALNPEKLHPSNQYAAIRSSKSLTEVERLKKGIWKRK